MSREWKKKLDSWLLFVMNFLILLVIVGMFFYYHRMYDQNLLEKNMENISNLNASSGEISMKFFESQKNSLLDISRYTTRHQLSLEELMDFLHDINSDERTAYELIGTDYQGYCSSKEEGEYYAISYDSKDYKSLQNIFKTADQSLIGTVNFAPEFTDGYTALKCFAFCTVIPVYEGDAVEYYTLMSISRSQKFIDMIQITGEYEGLTSVLFDQSGYYIIGNADFKSDNFFEYIYKYNDLTLDEKNELKNKVTSSETGSCFYTNNEKKNCAYVYHSLNEGQWYIVSCIPEDSFQGPEENYKFTLIAVLGIGIIFLLDVIWLMRVNRNLKTSAEKERRANAAKTDFLSRMSHDIRTPLNAVIGFSELASGEEDLSEETEDYLKKINSSGKYLLGLINDILDMSKIESKKIELHETLVYGPDFLQDIADMFTAQAKKKGITLKTDFSESQTPWVYMDALRSRQIYSNLLNNAIKFSEEGSTVTWKITDRILAENQMEMICVIADEGCGMSKEFMKHIFKPFEQEHNSHSDAEGGTGLGLSIVKSLVETMGGTISVESELGKGSTFTIKMSRRIGDGSEQEREGKQKTQDLTRLSGKRVLLCEDHPLNQEIALRLLKRQNVKAEVAENGKIGVDMFTAAKPGYFDMILMDIRMPVMDGLEATKAIRTSGKEGASSIPIIAMTANAFEDDIQSCIQAGMNAHVAKPINPDKLFHTMAQYFLE